MKESTIPATSWKTDRTKASGSGSISYVSKTQNIAAQGILILEWPNKMRLEVLDPIGGMLALLVLNERSFYWYDKNAEEAVTGDYSSRVLRKNFPFPIDNPKQLISVLLARPEQFGHISINNAIREPQEWLDAFGDGSGVQVTYENYETHGSQIFPHLVRIQFAQERFVWRWQEMRSSVPDKPEIFQIPPSGAPKVRLRKIEN